MRVVITGMSAVCALGCNAKEIEQNLDQGQSGIHYISQIQEPFFQQFPYGAISFEGANKWAEGDIQSAVFPVIDDCLKDAGLHPEGEYNLAMSLGTSLLGTQEYYDFLHQERKDVDVFQGRLQFIRSLYERYHVIRGVYITNIACASGTAAFEMAKDLLTDGTAELVICGGFDLLNQLSICGFHSMNSLSTRQAKPLDSERNGINLGEGAAFFVLESYEHAIRRNAKIYAEVVDCYTANEAYHVTSSNPTGTEIIHLIKRILDYNKVKADEINYINLHGTGTRTNDEIEAKVLKELFPETTKASSTKSYTGHCLGAAGAIEVYLSLLMMRRGKAVNTVHSREDLITPYKVKQEFYRIKYLLSMSYAFSGSISGILIKNIGTV